MSGTLIDAYIKALSELEEFAFQRAIVSRLLVALNNFQSVPTYPQGDGALDGHSHKGTRVYCCYGLKYDAAKTPLQRSRQIATKFSSDLRRLYELEPAGKKKFIHKDNDALLSIFGAVPGPAERICHVTLVTNWFESHHTARDDKAELDNIRRRETSADEITRDADIVVKGPKEFADQYGADESTMMWLKHQELPLGTSLT